MRPCRYTCPSASRWVRPRVWDSIVTRSWHVQLADSPMGSISIRTPGLPTAGNRPSGTDLPTETSVAAPRLTAGVIKFNVPLQSAGPHRPAFEHRVASSSRLASGRSSKMPVRSVISGLSLLGSTLLPAWARRRQTTVEHGPRRWGRTRTRLARPHRRPAGAQPPRSPAGLRRT